MTQGKKAFIGRKVGLAFLTVTLMVTGSLAFAQEESVLHSFADGSDGVSPYCNLIFDTAGNLYGTTFAGGTYGGGTVFELSPIPGGGWSEEILHSFGSGSDAQNPYAGVAFNAAGDIFGMTFNGGAFGYGAVFALSPKPGGGWREKVLHSFNNNGQDGFNPEAGVILDSSGNLYGTTQFGGAYGGGIVFELVNAGGSWFENILHSFDGNGKDGTDPQAGLIFDSSGNLYSTTSQGGIHGDGTVFELGRKRAGGWGEKILYSFNSKGGKGFYPTAGLTFDTAGNLYGVTGVGGAYGEGVAFELRPTVGGNWTESTLYSFGANSLNGYYPSGGLVFDSSGNLYGLANNGGAYDAGVVFELSPPMGGSWSYNVLYNFGATAEGRYPSGTLIFDAHGNLYGVTGGGGTDNFGTVFEVTP